MRLTDPVTPAVDPDARKLELVGWERNDRRGPGLAPSVISSDAEPIDREPLRETDMSDGDTNDQKGPQRHAEQHDEAELGNEYH